jgi:hypothetical protein
MDISNTIKPKSDQLNADDLIAGPRDIVITAVKVAESEQPVSIHFEGDDGKPYKPCKSMRRVIVAIWGADSKAYTGRALRLFCDQKVAFGGAQVGGIRISHASHIEKPFTMALTTTRAKRSPYTVQPMEMPAAPVKTIEATGIIEATGDGSVTVKGAKKTITAKASQEIVKIAAGLIGHACDMTMAQSGTSFEILTIKAHVADT